jgi:hypothetical protein
VACATWPSAAASAAACEGESDADADATLAFISPKAVIGMAVYSAGAMLHGKGHVWEMMVESIP